LQLRLLEQGVPIFWWDDLDYNEDPKTFAAANLIGVRGFMSDSATLHFRPKAAITQSERDATSSRAERQLPWPTTTRAQAAAWLCAELGLPSSEAVTTIRTARMANGDRRSAPDQSDRVRDVRGIGAQTQAPTLRRVHAKSAPRARTARDRSGSQRRPLRATIHGAAPT
jgi:hypothetical protein